MHKIVLSMVFIITKKFLQFKGSRTGIKITQLKIPSFLYDRKWYDRKRCRKKNKRDSLKGKRKHGKNIINSVSGEKMHKTNCR